MLRTGLLVGLVVGSLAIPVTQQSNSDENLYQALDSVVFRNQGVTTSSDNFHWELINPVGEGQKLCYLEADNVSCLACNWADGGKFGNPHPYLFKDHGSKSPRTPGHYDGDTPASGMRSAVPLGGIGAGSFELRGDGTFHEFTIANAGPQGAAKVQNYPDMFLGVGVGDEHRVLQTHPPPAMNGVEALKYSGSHPISRLETAGTSLHDDIELALYAYSHLKANDLGASSRPAVAFTLTAANTGDEPLNVSLTLTLPFALELDQLRAGTPLTNLSAPDAATCSRHCATEPKCMSWVFGRSAGTCTLQTDAPLNQFQAGVTSGVKATWSADQAAGCLVLDRPGVGPMHGQVALCDATSAGTDVVMTTADTPTDVFPPSSTSTVNSVAALGALTSRGVIPPHTNSTLTLTLGWYFPNRDHFNYNPANLSAFAPYGNAYARRYKSAVDAAWGTAAKGERTDAMVALLSDVTAVHNAVGASSVPEWLQDLLINSLSHTRDSMWWEKCAHCHEEKDPRVSGDTWGYWRQWEAYDCPDLDSIHNDGERHIPYIMLFPDATRSKLAAWAGNQLPNGMLAEQIHNSDPDTPEGRIMSDSTSMFIVYLLELLRWAGDEESVHLYYPTAKRAAMWQMNVSAEWGVPLKLETTYDILRFPDYDLSTYASVFHLLAMTSAAELADYMGDHTFADTCRSALERGQKAMDDLQWNATLGFYNAASNCDTTSRTCSGIGSFADAFYAQVLAYSLGLGSLLPDSDRLDAHLNYTWKTNCKSTDIETGELVPGCPNGLLIMTERPVQMTDLQIWEMATHDHVALVLHRNLLSPSAALALSEGTGTSYSQRINDQWNVAGIKFNDGYPSITSHYGYHMTSWHTVLALSGQVADMSTRNSSLTFAPKETCDYVLPILLPTALGTVSCEAGTFTVQLLSGKATVATLAVSGHTYPHSPVELVPGQPVQWSA